jgi:hypothetical protein
MRAAMHDAMHDAPHAAMHDAMHDAPHAAPPAAPHAAPMRAVPREELAAHLRDVCFVAACRVIGDEGLYNRYLSRQCACNNPDAVRLTGSLQVVEQVKAGMQEALQMLRAFRQARVVEVLENVLHAPVLLCGRSNIWAVCALTGRPGNDFVVVHGQHLQMLVDARLEGFVRCWWMLGHILDIETARVDAFCARGESADTIKHAIEAFVETAGVSEAETDAYHAAHEYVRGVLERTLAQCGGQGVEKHPAVSGAGSSDIALSTKGV